MMIPHHEGAVTMGKAEIAKGKDPELKALAEDIITAQEREITEMREHLGEDGTTTTEHGAGDAHGAIRPMTPRCRGARAARTCARAPTEGAGRSRHRAPRCSEGRDACQGSSLRRGSRRRGLSRCSVRQVRAAAC